MVDALVTQVNEVRALMETQLRVRGATLRDQVRKAGRTLPRAIRRDAQYLAQADGLAQNPKLARMVDQAKAAQAHRNVVEHLQSINVKDLALGRLLGWLSSVALALIVVFVVVVTVLVKRGFV